MPSTFTPNYALEKPGYDEQEETWGATLNANMDGIDTALKTILDELRAYKAAEVGTMKFYGFTDGPPAGYIGLRGRSIGSALSGATERANADMAALYAKFWSLPDGVIPIQTSAGAATTRGVSASADFAANKRLVTPDTRGEFIRGWDDLRGVDSLRAILSAQADEVRAHTHSITLGGDAPGVIPADGSGSTNIGSTASYGGSETRPRNVAAMVIMKY